ncbi:MAG: hypothetical protein VYC49_13885, partial [Pseudomonadota bacterium]|nr:hypothetical protein [Pseudomonadota bacterium]
WRSEAVAKRYLALLNDEVPDSWWCSPADISYLGGLGVSDKELKAMARYIVDHYGWDAFQLQGKSSLEEPLARLIGQKSADENA